MRKIILVFVVIVIVSFRKSQAQNNFMCKCDSTLMGKLINAQGKITTSYKKWLKGNLKNGIFVGTTTEGVYKQRILKTGNRQDSLLHLQYTHFTKTGDCIYTLDFMKERYQVDEEGAAVGELNGKDFDPQRVEELVDLLR